MSDSIDRFSQESRLDIYKHSAVNNRFLWPNVKNERVTLQKALFF